MKTAERPPSRGNTNKRPLNRALTRMNSKKVSHDDEPKREDSKNSRQKRISTLSLHLGITAGPVNRVVIGVPALRLDYFVVGDCMKDLGGLLDEASAGEIAVSNRVINTLHDTIGENDLATDTPSAPPAMPNILSEDPLHAAFINQAFLFRLEANFRRRSSLPLYDTAIGNNPGQVLSENTALNPIMSAIPTEYRHVSVLFIRIAKDTGGDTGRKSKTSQDTQIKYMQQMISILLIILEKHQGVFQQCSVLAVRAAMEFRSEVSSAWQASKKQAEPQFDQYPSISVTSGDILFGTVGCARRMEGSFLGDVFNVAARLLDIQRPQGCIALDTASAKEVESTFQPTSLGKFKLKGKTEEMEVWGILDRPQISDQASSLRAATQKVVGNKKEWDQLKSGLDGAFLGQSQGFMAIVEGPAGIGKSSLVSLVRSYIVEKGKEICIARGSEVEQFRPFSAIQKLIAQLIPPAFIKVGSLENEINLLPEYKEERRNSVSALLFKSKMSTASFTPTSITAGLRVILKECGEDPQVAAAVEDLIFPKNKSSIPGDMGPLTRGVVIRMLGYFFSKARRILLLDDAQADIALPKDSENLIAAVYEKTSGNMLQVDSIRRYLQSIKEEDVSAELVYSILDRTVDSLLMAQFDRLSNFFQKILRSASVLGHYFPMDDLFYLIGESPESVTALEEAIRTQNQFDFLKTDVDESGNTILCFRHVNIRNAVYETKIIDCHIEYGCELARVLQYHDCIEMLLKAANLLETVDQAMVTREKKRKALATLANTKRGEMVYTKIRAKSDLSKKGSPDREWFDVVFQGLNAILAVVIAAPILPVDEYYFAITIRCRSCAPEWFQTTLYLALSASAKAATAGLCRYYSRLAVEAKPFAGTTAYVFSNMVGLCLTVGLDRPRETVKFTAESVEYWRRCRNDLQVARSIMNIHYSATLLGDLTAVRSYMSRDAFRLYSKKDSVMCLVPLSGALNESFFSGCPEDWKAFAELTPYIVEYLPTRTRIFLGYCKPFTLLMAQVLFNFVDQTPLAMLGNMQAVVDEYFEADLATAPAHVVSIFLGVLVAFDAVKHKIGRTGIAAGVLNDFASSTSRLIPSANGLSTLLTPLWIGKGLVYSLHALALDLSGQIPLARLWKRKAFQCLTQMSRCRRFRGNLQEGGEFFFLGALLNALFGKLSDDETKRRAFLRRAGSMFETMKAGYLVKWVNSQWD
ncbi:hypothetical protein HDU96_010247 [Phlyctochytrium bullatum]|nr:hypothetical protein HDU96_010247 [Phlyctochytrium bullatum]